MKAILFMFALVMSVLSAVVYVASGMEQHGQGWARDVCGLYNLCENMHWLFAATACVILAYFFAPRVDA